MELNNLPIIDWELSLRLAGNKKETVDALLDLLIKTLPQDIKAIKQAYEIKNNKSLVDRLHKLHGALCYCGVPRLKNSVVELEMRLKKNAESDVGLLIDQLEIEANLVLKQNLLR